jgi:hypothetical protein
MDLPRFLLRAPTAMFLRYKEKEDIYAIDADKEYDYANILMNLGKSMEKQLTMPKDSPYNEGTWQSALEGDE